ncbi:NTF2-related export protein-like [Clavelina lepadiformis]|uniref:NTF2-related export protein n=1 Tax=Clavelina lepadiformis TaxID=159417 RepID=A0ABP0F528_CLALP
MTLDRSPPTLKFQIEQSIEAGTKFCSLFYETYDKTRHKIGKMYHEAAQLVWEGNGVQGKESIEKYLQDLPGCFHIVDWFDCQPILPQFTNGNESILVAVGGTVKFDNHTLKAFVQNFTLTNVEGVWKIVSDALRLRPP